MAQIVEGYKFIQYPTTNYDPKNSLKNTFIRMLWECFAADRDNLNFTDNPDARGLKVWPRYPQLRDQLPVITVSFSQLVFEALNVNVELGPQQTAYIDELFYDEAGYGTRQGYKFTGIMTLDIAALSDTQRDRLIDKLFEYLVWRRNNAGLHIRQYLIDRGVIMNTARVATAGESEVPMETNDLMYIDAMSVPILGEVYSDKKLYDTLLGISWEGIPVPYTE